MLAHPGPCVLPAVLATAELDRATGRDLLMGLVAGYEIECRLAGDFLPSTQARGFRSSPIYGTFGAAVGASKTKRLGENAMHSAIGWASTFTAGLVDASHAFHEPNSTRNGLLASIVAGDQFPGSERSGDGTDTAYSAILDDGRGGCEPRLRREPPPGLPVRVRNDKPNPAPLTSAAPPGVPAPVGSRPGTSAPWSGRSPRS